MDDIFNYSGDEVGFKVALLSLLLAFILSQAVAGLYAWSYRGMSYSRGMVQSLVLAGIVAAILMLAIGNNITRGLGIIGTMALIRFRTNLRDPWDITFVFAAFAVGIAAGTQSYEVAVMGLLVFGGAVVMLSRSSFGSKQQFDGLLRLFLPSAPDAHEGLQEMLKSHCKSFVLVTLREMGQGEEHEHVYQVRLRDPEGQGHLLSGVTELPGARAVSLHMQEATVEL